MSQPAIISADSCILAVVDLQEKFRPVIHEMDRVVDKSVRLLQIAKMLRVPHIVTEQYPKGLGSTVPELAILLDQKDVHAKTSFSFMGDAGAKAAIEASGRRQVILAGIETHVCISQSANDLLAAGYDVFLIEDALSSRYPFDHVTAVDRLRMNGAVICSLEMVLFEWLKDANHPNFKAVSALVK